MEVGAAGVLHRLDAAIHRLHALVPGHARANHHSNRWFYGGYAGVIRPYRGV